MAEKVKCPVCGKHYFDERDDYDICPTCYWENDAFQVKYPDRSDANRMSLNEARKAYREGRQVR